MSTLVLLSGGMDSTVLLASCLESATGPVEALCIDYGQRHAREQHAAAAVAAHYGVRLTTVTLPALSSVLPSALTQDGGEVPHGHYADDSMKATVVPNRNAILLMIAAGVAAGRGHSWVATAVHAGDHPVYPDCRPEFIEAASHAASLGTGGAVSIIAPFVDRTKTDIARRGADLDAPLHLTWSCYEGGDVHCGKCGTCVERKEAFTDAGLDDPTEYA